MTFLDPDRAINGPKTQGDKEAPAGRDETVLPGPDVAGTSNKSAAGAVVLNWGRLCPPGGIWRHRKTYFIVTTGLEDLLSSRGWGPGMLLNILRCTSQPPPHGGSQPKSPLTSRSRKLEINQHCLLAG